jgi:hypothetical protein
MRSKCNAPTRATSKPRVTASCKNKCLQKERLKKINCVWLIKILGGKVSGDKILGRRKKTLIFFFFLKSTWEGGTLSVYLNTMPVSRILVLNQIRWYGKVWRQK